MPCIFSRCSHKSSPRCLYVCSCVLLFFSLLIFPSVLVTLYRFSLSFRSIRWTFPFLLDTRQVLLSSWDFPQLSTVRRLGIFLVDHRTVYRGEGAGSISGRTSDCRGKCFTKQCPCKKVGVFCATKYHSKLEPCKNMGD